MHASCFLPSSNHTSPDTSPFHLRSLPRSIKVRFIQKTTTPVSKRQTTDRPTDRPIDNGHLLPSSLSPTHIRKSLRNRPSMLLMSVLNWSKQHRRKNHQLSTPQQLENCKFVVSAIGAYSFVGNFFVLYLLFDDFDGVGGVICY